MLDVNIIMPPTQACRENIFHLSLSPEGRKKALRNGDIKVLFSAVERGVGGLGFNIRLQATSRIIS